LLEAVWGDTFVEEGNLKQYISHLRKALGDNSEDTRLIVTIARKGYQFTADVIVAIRVVVPASFRKALGINIGDEVFLRIEDDELRITTLKRRVERARRLVRKHVKRGTPLVDELIAERREAARDD
jgi:bifunctional DNA-binding transcriptional regulator/antitoxin component of YhaV-PrlF toxin-antitoxin module